MGLPEWVSKIFVAAEPEPAKIIFDVDGFKKTIQEIKAANKNEKIELIEQLMNMSGFIMHHEDKTTKCVVLATCKEFEYDHEHNTSKKLTEANYNVILMPGGYFKRHEKRFDVFLLRGHILLEADLKCLTTKNPDTIGKRIKEGSHQAPRLVIDIASNIEKKTLIEGLRTGCEKNDSLNQILLFYNSRFYPLQKMQILGRNIYDLIK